MTDAPVCELTIVICTFRREELLARAIASLTAQRRPEGLSFELLVVDNSDDGSAAAVVESAAGAASFPVRRVEAHPPNISVARNAGVRSSQSPFVLFIDDDEELDPDWLETVARAIRTLPHDIIIGGVEPSFERPERATPFVQQLFSRRLDCAMGEDLYAFGPKRTAGVALAIANAIFRRATTFTEPEPFDVTFGNCGGEDYDLLCRLQSRGRRIGWMPGAIVREFVPASRCEPAYLRRRFFAGGQAYAAAVAGVSRNPRAMRWWLRVKAFVQAVILALRAPLNALASPEQRLDYSYVWAGVLGKLSLGGLYPVYRASHAGRRPDVG